jgi:hypothetical protein
MSSRHYINNKKMYEEFCKYREIVQAAKAEGRELPRIPEYIGECFYKIATRLSTKYRFANYTYRDEMISDAIENCVMVVNGFDPNKSNNPFAYFTQVIRNAFFRRIMKEKKQQYVKYRSMQKMTIDSGLSLHQEMDDARSIENSYLTMEHVNEFIKDYENYLQVTKEKSKKAKKGIEKIIEEQEEDEASAAE